MKGKEFKGNRKAVLRKRICERCGRYFNSYAKSGRFCEDCKLSYFEGKWISNRKIREIKNARRNKKQ